MTIERPLLFLDRLRESQLLEQARLEELAALPEAAAPEPQTLARLVLKRGWLTRYQLNQVGQGKARDLKVGPYVILDRLGEGGMGLVFKANHQHMQRTVALKVIRRERLASPDAVKRFYQEVQAAAQLVHPHIVLAYDAGPAGNTHYFAMELVEGIDLSRLVKQSGPLPVALACEYAHQTLLGLQHAFEKGLVHRDIKPANLLLGGEAGKDGRKGTIKILDMGLARFSGGEREKGLTQTGQVIGTPDFLAPEQAMDSRQADTRADIYSLGCTLYYLLAGKAPFQGETLTQVLLQHQMEKAAPISGRSDVPAALQAVIARMMAKNPADRYQTPAEAAAALEPFCRGEAVAGEESVFAAIAETTGRVKAWEETLGGDEPAPRPSGRKTAVTASALPSAGTRKKKGTGQQPDNKPKLLLIALSGGSVLLLALIGLVVWLMTRPGTPVVATGPVSHAKDKDSKERDLGKANNKDAKNKNKDKDKNSANPPDPIVKVPNPEPVGDPPSQVLPPATGESPLDKLDPAKVPAENRPPGLTELVAVLRGHPGEVFGLAFSGDGKRLISGANDNTARVWDLTGAEPRQVAILKGHAGFISGVALTPNGQTAATGGDDRTVRVWDLSGAEPRVRDVLADHDTGFSSVAISPDGKTLAFSGPQGEIRLFDLSPDKPEKLASLKGHMQSVASLSFSRDGKTLVSVSNDRTAWLWDMTKTPVVQKRVVDPFVNSPMGVRLSPDGKKLIAGGMDGFVHLWDLSGARPKELASAKAHEWANSCVFAPDGKSYFSTGGGGSNQPPAVAVWWSSADGSKRKEWVLPERSSSGTLSPDGRYLALSCHDHNIYILRLPGGGVLPDK